MANRFLYLARHGDAVDDGPLSEAGRQQARLLGARLSELPITAIHHSPLQRAVETTRLISAHLPAAAPHESELVGDYVPAAPDRATLPAAFGPFVDSFTPAELADGPPLAEAAIAKFTGPSQDTDRHELIVTHAFLVAWFIRHALDAPVDRWIGLNAANCALTVILYRPERPPTLVVVNDMGHLPQHLRWTGFPPPVAGSSI
jgi:serine/threonine-protein phosphatase PGAM5